MQLIIGSKAWSSWSLRAWLMVKASGWSFEEIFVALRQPDTKAQILRWSPSGKIPCLIDEGLVIWDSLAIAEYVAEAVPSLWPQDRAARARARSVSAEMHSGFVALRTHMPMDAGAALSGQTLAPEAEDAVRADIARITRIWADCRQQFGADGPFLFGQYSLADMMFAPVAFRFESYGVLLEDAAATRYLHTLLAHPHMQAWKQAALAETAALAQGGD